MISTFNNLRTPPLQFGTKSNTCIDGGLHAVCSSHSQVHVHCTTTTTTRFQQGMTRVPTLPTLPPTSRRLQLAAPLQCSRHLDPYFHFPEHNNVSPCTQCSADFGRCKEQRRRFQREQRLTYTCQLSSSSPVSVAENDHSDSCSVPRSVDPVAAYTEHFRVVETATALVFRRSGR